MLLVTFQVAQCNMPGMGNPRQQRDEDQPGDISSCTHTRTPVLPMLPRDYEIKFTVFSAYLAKHIRYGLKVSENLPAAN